jgi:hypothetical protein
MMLGFAWIAVCYGGVSCQTGGEIGRCLIAMFVNYCCLFLFMCCYRKKVLAEVHHCDTICL